MYKCSSIGGLVVEIPKNNRRRLHEDFPLLISLLDFPAHLVDQFDVCVRQEGSGSARCNIMFTWDRDTNGRFSLALDQSAGCLTFRTGIRTISLGDGPRRIQRLDFLNRLLAQRCSTTEEVPNAAEIVSLALISAPKYL